MTETGEHFTYGTPVTFLGERYRVRRELNGGRDIEIWNAEHSFIVSPLTVKVGW